MFASITNPHDKARSRTRKDSANIPNVCYHMQMKPFLADFETFPCASIVETDRTLNLLISIYGLLDFSPIVNSIDKDNALDSCHLLKIDVTIPIAIRVFDIPGKIGSIGVTAKQDAHRIADPGVCHHIKLDAVIRRLQNGVCLLRKLVVMREDGTMPLDSVVCDI